MFARPNWEDRTVKQEHEQISPSHTLFPVPVWCDVDEQRVWNRRAIPHRRLSMFYGVNLRFEKRVPCLKIDWLHTQISLDEIHVWMFLGTTFCWDNSSFQVMCFSTTSLNYLCRFCAPHFVHLTSEIGIKWITFHDSNFRGTVSAFTLSDWYKSLFHDEPSNYLSFIFNMCVFAGISLRRGRWGTPSSKMDWKSSSVQTKEQLNIIDIFSAEAVQTNTKCRAITCIFLPLWSLGRWKALV